MMAGRGVIFSSADLPKKDRFHIWREMFSLKMVGLDASHTDPRPFFVKAKFLDLGCVKVARSTGTSGKYFRTPKLVAADGYDDFAFNINVAGRWELTQSRRRVVMDGPGATLVNTGAVAEGALVSSSLWEHVEFVSLCIPRQVLLKRLPQVDRLVLTPIGHQETLRSLEAYLNLIESQGIGDDPALGVLVGEHILDLVTCLLGQGQDAQGETRKGGLRAARLAELTSFLEKNYRCPGLSVDDVASALNISRRYLFDLMDETDESFTQMLNRFRLERARQLLTDPNYGHLGIADIALDSGFSDLSYFYRQFRRRFGETPGAFRVRGSSSSGLGEMPSIKNEKNLRVARR